MIEYFILMALLGPLMARRRKARRRPSRFVVIPVFTTLALSTLASNIVIKGNLLNNVEDVWITSADLMLSIRNLPTGEGPIGMGCANDDLSVTEIAEAISAAPTGPDDIIQNERARRPVRNWAQFSGHSTATSDEVIADGLVKRYKVRMRLGENTALAVWAQNRSGASLSGNATIVIQGKLYGNWK